jgi:hypothetical protein
MFFILKVYASILNRINVLQHNFEALLLIKFIDSPLVVRL